MAQNNPLIVSLADIYELVFFIRISRGAEKRGFKPPTELKKVKFLLSLPLLFFFSFFTRKKKQT